MLRHFLITISVGLCLRISAQDINVGVGPTIAFKNAIFGIQGRVVYGIQERFSVSGAFNYYVRENVNYAIDADFRVKLFSLQEYEFHPFIGTSLYRIGSTKTALTAGLFTRIDRDWVDIYIEPKFLFDEDSYFVLSGGLYF